MTLIGTTDNHATDVTLDKKWGLNLDDVMVAV